MDNSGAEHGMVNKHVCVWVCLKMTVIVHNIFFFNSDRVDWWWTSPSLSLFVFLTQTHTEIHTFNPIVHIHTHRGPPTQSIRRKEGEINQLLMRSTEWEAGPSRHFHLWCTLPCYYNLSASLCVCVCPLLGCFEHLRAHPDPYVTQRGLNKAERRAGRGWEGVASDKGASKQTWHAFSCWHSAVWPR